MTFHVSAPSADHLRGLIAEVGAMLTGRRTSPRDPAAKPMCSPLVAGCSAVAVASEKSFHSAYHSSLWVFSTPSAASTVS